MGDIAQADEAERGLARFFHGDVETPVDCDDAVGPLAVDDGEGGRLPVDDVLVQG